MGPHYVDFTCANAITLILLEMIEICSKFVAKVFLPLPLESSAQNPLWDRVKVMNDNKVSFDKKKITNIHI